MRLSMPIDDREEARVCVRVALSLMCACSCVRLFLRTHVMWQRERESRKAACVHLCTCRAVAWAWLGAAGGARRRRRPDWRWRFIFGGGRVAVPCACVRVRILAWLVLLYFCFLQYKKSLKKRAQHTPRQLVSRVVPHTPLPLPPLVSFPRRPYSGRARWGRGSSAACTTTTRVWIVRVQILEFLPYVRIVLILLLSGLWAIKICWGGIIGVTNFPQGQRGLPFAYCVISV
jgi:hypothetical protein